MKLIFELQILISFLLIRHCFFSLNLELIPTYFCFVVSFSRWSFPTWIFGLRRQNFCHRHCFLFFFHKLVSRQDIVLSFSFIFFHLYDFLGDGLLFLFGILYCCLQFLQHLYGYLFLDSSSFAHLKLLKSNSL